MGEQAGLDEQLDALYKSLKAKEIGSQVGYVSVTCPLYGECMPVTRLLRALHVAQGEGDRIAGGAAEVMEAMLPSCYVTVA